MGERQSADSDGAHFHAGVANGGDQRRHGIVTFEISNHADGLNAHGGRGVLKASDGERQRIGRATARARCRARVEGFRVP